MPINTIGKSNPMSKLLEAAVKNKAQFYGSRADADIKWLVTPSPTFNYMMGGGIPIGRMIRFRGPASAGKTVVATWCAGLCQREIPKLLNKPDQKVVVYMDVECSFTRDWANKQGLSTNDMIVKDDQGNVTAINADGDFIQVRGTSVEAMCDEVMPLIETGCVAAIVFDSDGQAASQRQLLDEAGKASFGGAAKAMSEMLNKMVPACAIYNTTLFWITQERCQMDPMKFLPATSGGEKPGFAASIVLRIQSREDIKNKGEIVGHYLRARNMKNKCSVMGRDAFMYLNFMEWKDDKGTVHPAGFETDREYVSYFVLCDLLHKETSASGRANGYYSNEEFGIRIRGEENIAAYFADPANAETYEKMKKRCNDLMRGHIDALDTNLHSEGDEMANANAVADTSSAISISELAAAAMADEIVGEE